MSVLCYHTVQPGWRSPLAVTPAAFERHCAWLARHRIVLDLGTALTQLDRHSFRLPAGCAHLTFDDGFASLYDHALPVLRRYDLPATVFLVAETLLDPPRAVDWIDPPPAATPATLTLDQVREMQEEGVTFASHSASHRDLTSLTEHEAFLDLRTSRELLGDLLGHAVHCLAYPRGRHDLSVRRAAARAGYTHAFSLPERREPLGPYAIPRVGIFPDNGVAALRVKSSRAYVPIRTSPAYPLLRLVTRGNRRTLPGASGLRRGAPARR